jgi:hypothetical protein
LTESVYYPKKCDGFLIEELDGELVLLHPARNIVIHANRTAALVWELCDGQYTVPQIVQLLSDAYPDASAQIEEEVPATIRELRKKGALEGG